MNISSISIPKRTKFSLLNQNTSNNYEELTVAWEAKFWACEKKSKCMWEIWRKISRTDSIEQVADRIEVEDSERIAGNPETK